MVIIYYFIYNVLNFDLYLKKNSNIKLTQNVFKAGLSYQIKICIMKRMSGMSYIFDAQGKKNSAHPRLLSSSVGGVGACYEVSLGSMPGRLFTHSVMFILLNENIWKVIF